LYTPNAQAAKAYYARAEQRCRLHIIDARRKRNGEVRPDEDVLGIPAIDRIAGKSRRLAQVLHLVPTEPAIAIDSTHPAHADATCERKTLGCPVDYFTHDLVSWYELRHQSWQISLYDMEVSSTDSARNYTQEHVPRFEVGLRDLCYRHKG
jgi:hypothetical protein